MSLAKEIYWFNRKPCDRKNGVYLFWKSLETLQDKDFLQKHLVSQSQNGEMKPPLVSDPVLMYILGLEKSIPSFDDIVSFYEKEAEKHQDGLPFVDICFYFNKVHVAQKFAVAHHLTFNISTFNRTNEIELGSVAPYEEDFSRIWLQLKEKTNEVPLEQLIQSAELFGFALRFASGNKMNVILEMAGRGYLWDSFILMSLFYPDDDTTKQLRSAVWKLYDLRWTDELNCLSPNSDQVVHLLEIGLRPALCYERVKLRLMNNIQNEFLRSTMYTEIRVCLMSAVCNDNGDLGYFEIAKDFLAFALTESTILAEFLPAMQKNYFEQAFVVMSDLVKTVLHLCNVSRFGPIEDYGIDSRGMIHSIVAGWIDLKVLPQEETSLLRAMKGIHEIIYAFIGDIADCSKIPVVGFDCKGLVLLALRIGEVMFNGRLGDRNDSIIFDIVKNSKDCQDFILKLLQSTCDTSLSPLLDKAVSSLRRTLMNVLKMFEKPHTLPGRWVSNEKKEDMSQHSAAASVSIESNCSTSSESTSVSPRNDDKMYMKSTAGSATFCCTEVSTEIDKMIKEAHFVADVVPVTDMTSSLRAASVVEEDETTSVANCSLSQPTVNESVVSSQSSDSEKEASVSESANTSKRASSKKIGSFSSNFENEDTNIWSSNNKTPRQYHAANNAGFGKISDGFGASSQTATEGFGVAPPHAASYNYRGRPNWRGAHRNGDAQSGSVSDTVFGGRRGGYQCRGAYVPRGRGGYV